jgi:hypothetical protein
MGAESTWNFKKKYTMVNEIMYKYNAIRMHGRTTVATESNMANVRTDESEAESATVHCGNYANGNH